MKTDEIISVKPEDARNFRIGMTLVWPRRRRLYWWLMRVTRWWRPRIAVTAINVETGTITNGIERWSWRRWRWERVT